MTLSSEDRDHRPAHRTAEAAAPATPAGDDPAAGRSVLLGAILGIDTIGHCVALATLAFAGPLAFALGYGTMLILLSSAIISFVLAWRSVFPGAAGIAEDTTIAILAPAMITAAAAVSGPPEARLATAVTIMGLSTLLSGAAIYLIGRFHLGRIARIMPFPVAAGFLTGSGWLLVASALFLLTDTANLPDLARRLMTEGVPPNLVLGGALALGFVIAARVVTGALAAFLPLATALVAFYAALSLSGISLDEARAMGLLPVIDIGALPPHPDIGLVAQIDWPVVLSASLTIAAIVLLNAIGFMLNVGGIEMAVRTDISIDAEARTTGAANIAIGSFGGILGFVASDSTIVAHRLGCNSRILGVTLGATTLLGCLFAGPIVAHVPVFVAAGLLLYFGLMMLDDWLVATRARLRLLDWAIIPIILGVTIAIDILAAIVTGVLVALVIFVFTYARQPVIRFEGSGLTRRSPVDRTPAEDAVLADRGAQIHILALQGFLFFGSVEKVTDALRRRLARPDPIETLVIDFTHVSGLDSAACAAILKLGLLAERGGFRVIFAAVPPDLADMMQRWGIGAPDDPVFRMRPSLGSALEEAEAALIARHGRAPSGDDTLLSRLSLAIPRAAELMARMDRLEAAPGEVLIRTGGTEGDIFFVETGRLDVQLPSANGTPTRLRSLRDGAIVGEAARYLRRIRTADVVVVTPSVIWRLSDDAIDRLEREDRDLAAQLHAAMARSLAEKVEKTNGLLTAALA